MKKILLMLLILLCFAVPVKADSSMYADSVYVEITVNENNSFDIKETINIDFLSYHHGIIRSIPAENTIIRENGYSNTNYAILSNVECNVNYSKSRENGNYIIKMGDADVLVIGEMQYVLSYHYDIGNDPLQGVDELYLNVIGNEWDYEIRKLDVVIHMPKDFDYSKLGVSHGRYGSQDYSGVIQERNGNDIHLTYDKTLIPGEAFTVRLELEDNYFTKKNSIMSFITSLIAPIIAIFAFLKSKANYDEFGKPDPVIDVVEFYPPGNLTPPKMAKVKDNFVSDYSVNALLISLANKGYVTIKEDGKDFTLTIKQPDTSLVGEERMYLLGLHKYAEEKNGKLFVTKKDLKNKFYTTIGEIQQSVESVVGSVFEPFGKYVGASISGGLLLVAGTVGIISLSKFGTIDLNLLKYCSWYEYVSLGIVGILGILMILFGFCYRKRTPENNALLGRINGFTTFLETAEKDRLEMLVEENPTYFYDILPYAYALGVSDKWISRFEDMMIAPPEWYNGNDLYHFMDTTMENISDIASSSPSSGSSGSSSSGGGFSGGGSGGGGSSGW